MVCVHGTVCMFVYIGTDSHVPGWLTSQAVCVARERETERILQAVSKTGRQPKNEVGQHLVRLIPETGMLYSCSRSSS